MILLLTMIGCDWVLDAFEGPGKKREELPVMINAIKKAQIDNFELLGFYVDADPYPKEPGEDPQSWEIADSGGFKDIAWSPGIAVYGSYSIKVTGDDFVVTGVSDLDGDGVLATYTATKDTDPELKTDKGIY